ncbi:FAD-dependent oxidoreductase [Pelagibius sp.]|uniref:GcvT family protein n=1 Tax=Pelagibius sp. TaxID=1931238 RepID=UPI002619A7B7|nr:FAD-dependent oxidoreductase [Pelagibius sp.]
MSDLPSHARVVIIGGGAVGASTLYHLAKMGCSDAVLLEKNELTSGSTWHAAGNCPTFSGSWNMMKLQRYSAELFGRLADDVDYPMNYHRTGSIRIAQSDARMAEFRHVASMAGYQGMEYEVLGVNEVKDRYPFLELHDLKGGLWDPMDGDIDPAQLTQAYAKGARDLGAKVVRFCAVTGLSQLPSGEWKVESDKGTIIAEKVVNAAGYRAAEIGRMVGRDVPTVAMSHQYLVTEEIPELAALDHKVPLLRDPDDSYYLRQEGKGLILGPYEWQATPHWLDGMPDDFSFQLYPDDLDRLEWYIEQACARVPMLASGGVQRVINGPIPYTPDGNPLVGPAPGLTNFYEACVFSFGIAQSGGAGKTMAEWIVEGEPEWDLWVIDPRRYTDFATKRYVVDKAVEFYQHEYAMHFPHEERPAGRPAKVSPLYERLKAKGAVFGARGGWERAVWFAEAGAQPEADLTLVREGNWYPAVAAESRAVAEAVGILDLPGFARFEVKGPGTADWLDSLVAGALPKVGRISLGYFCSPRGGVVTEMTLTRLGEDHFWLISAAAGEWHDEDWLRSHRPADAAFTLENITNRWSTLVLAGPKAREVLGPVTESDLSNGAFPWLSVQPIEVAQARGFAIRVNYVGELGWELHLPIETVAPVYDLLWQAGEAHGIRDFGMYAMDSLRLEKGYMAWKQDLASEYSPLMGALDRFVKLDKAQFVGREALLKEKQAGPRERFVPLLVEAKDADAPFCATVWKGERRVGLVTSGGYGHRIEKSIALAYVQTDLAKEGEALEVEIYGERCPARVGVSPLFDPKNERLRA